MESTFGSQGNGVVRSLVPFPETKLTIREGPQLSRVCVQVVRSVGSNNFLDGGEQSNGSVVGGARRVFPLRQEEDLCLQPVLWDV